MKTYSHIDRIILFNSDPSLKKKFCYNQYDP